MAKKKVYQLIKKSADDDDDEDNEEEDEYYSNSRGSSINGSRYNNQSNHVHASTLHTVEGDDDYESSEMGSLIRDKSNNPYRTNQRIDHDDDNDHHRHRDDQEEEDSVDIDLTQSPVSSNNTNATTTTTSTTTTTTTNSNSLFTPSVFNWVSFINSNGSIVNNHSRSEYSHQQQLQQQQQQQQPQSPPSNYFPFPSNTFNNGRPTVIDVVDGGQVYGIDDDDDDYDNDIYSLMLNRMGHITNQRRSIQALQTTSNNFKLENGDIIVIEQPSHRVSTIDGVNNSSNHSGITRSTLSIGFNEKKFHHHLKTGEHDPHGFYSSLTGDGSYDQQVQQLLNQQNNGGGGDSNLIFLDANGENIDYMTREDISFARERYHRNRRLLISILFSEIFFSCMDLVDNLKLSWIMGCIVFVIMCDLVGVYTLSKDRLKTYSFILFTEGFLMLLVQFWLTLPPLFTFTRLITFLLSLRIRKELLNDFSYV